MLAGAFDATQRATESNEQVELVLMFVGEFMELKNTVSILHI